MTSTTLAGAAAALAAGVALGGAGRPQATPAQTFKASTVVVEVDAIVTGADGKFLADLKPDDFEILEDGRPQAIQTVYLVRGGTMAAVERSPAAGPAAAAPPAAPRRVFVVFFDQDHLDQGEFRRLQGAAETFLTSQFQPGDVGGVVIGGKMAGDELTSDRDKLVAAIRGAKLAGEQRSRLLESRDWPRMSDVEALRIAVYRDDRILGQVVGRAAADLGGGQADVEGAVRAKASQMAGQLREASGRVLGVLQGLTRGLARVPGRKTIVLLSDGFYTDEAMGRLRDIVGEAARANVRLYSIDGRGTNRRGAGTDLSMQTPLDAPGSIPTDQYNTMEDGPNTLAADTGGYVLRGTNDFKGAFAEIARDTSHYYVLGYSPKNAALDSSYRTISVRVKRAGARVRARKGYLALAAPPEPIPEEPIATPPPAPRPTQPPAAPVAPRPAPAGGETAPVTPVPATPTAAPAAPARTAAPATTLRPDAEERVKALAEHGGTGADAKSFASQGWDRYGQGDLEGAAALLSRAVAEPGAAPWVSYALGFAQLGLDKPKEAVDAWERVREEVPQFESVYLDLADAYLRLEDPGRAIDVLRDAEQRWPADPDVLNGIGTIQVRRGIYNDAIKTFAHAIEVRPDDGLAHFNLARTYELHYYTMRRFSRPGARWMDNPEELKKALAEYQAYLKIDGPFADQARAGIDRIERTLRLK